MRLVAGLALAVLAGVWARRRLVVVEVEGTSMAPSYLDGDRLLVRRITGGVRPGQVVVFGPPIVPDDPDPPPPPTGPGRTAGRMWLVKRVAAVPGDPVPAALPATTPARVPPDHFVALGDNPAESHDSRQEGFIPYARIRGSVLCKIGIK